MTDKTEALPPLQGGLTNDELRAALESKLQRGATYSDQDLTPFALGIEYGMALAQRQQVPADALRDALQRILDWDAAGLALTDDHIAAARAALTAAPSAQAEPTVPVPTVVAWSGGAAPYRFVRLRLDETPIEYEYVPASQAAPDDEPRFTAGGGFPGDHNGEKAAQAEPQEPLTEADVFHSDDIMAVNADAQLGMIVLMQLVRAIERAHGIGKQEGK